MVGASLLLTYPHPAIYGLLGSGIIEIYVSVFIIFNKEMKYFDIENSLIKLKPIFRSKI